MWTVWNSAPVRTSRIRVSASAVRSSASSLGRIGVVAPPLAPLPMTELVPAVPAVPVMSVVVMVDLLGIDVFARRLAVRAYGGCG